MNKSRAFLGRLVALSPHHLLVVALLAAAVFRFWRLDSLPPGLYHDEAYYGLDALSLLRGETFPIFYEGWELYAADAHAGRPATPTRFPIFFEGNYGREPLHVYLVALSIKLFGPTPFAIRAVAAAAGVVAVFTTYLAATALQGRDARRSPWLAPLAAFVLAILYPALTFSRFGIRAMLFVPVETLVVYCFWRGVAAGEVEPAMEQTGRSTLAPRRPALWFAGAGLFLGLGLYTYAAARLLPLLFVAFIPIWFWRDRVALRRYGRPVVLMAVAAAAAAAPLLLFFARYPYFFIFRTGYVANRGLGAVPGKPWLTWLGNVGRVFRGLFWQGENHLRHNLPGRPYLDAIQAVFFLAGVGRMALPIGTGDGFRWRSASRLFVLLWLGVMLLPTILSGDAPHFGRMTGAAPVVAILVAAGAVWLVDVVSKATAQPAGRLFQALILLAFLASAAMTWRDYFGRYADHPELPGAFYVGDWELGRYAAAQPADAVMYLTPTQEEMATIYYALEGQRDRLRSYYGPGGALPAGRQGSPAVYFVRPGDDQALARLAAYFPTGATGPAGAGLVPFHVPAAAPRILAEHPADVSWGGQIRLVGWSQTPANGQLVVELAWQAEAAMDRSYTAFVHLLDAGGALVAQLDRPPGGYPTSDWRPGEVIVDRYAIPLPAALPAGAYSLQTGFYDPATLERLGEPARLGAAEMDR